MKCLCVTCCNKECGKRVGSIDGLIQITTSCSNYKAPTNANRIRAMTDEELGEFIQRMIDVGDTSEVYCTGKPECVALIDSEDDIPEAWCRDCLLEWLRQPAEGIDAQK